MKIIINSIIQMGGKPENIVLDALKQVEKTINEDKKLKIIENKISDLDFDEETKFFIGFVESEIQFQNTDDLINFLFFYNPNNVEVVSPSKFNFELNELNVFLNNILSKNLEDKNEIRNLRAHIHLMNNKKN